MDIADHVALSCSGCDLSNTYITDAYQLSLFGSLWFTGTAVSVPSPSRGHHANPSPTRAITSDRFVEGPFACLGPSSLFLAGEKEVQSSWSLPIGPFET
ncbi:unnamed protein product [Somion occarium]|uniref:Uncharacterized protein n=1 Tax=Somion occarium TaxID=3059160 RepID=A0ABP1DWV5_9APHY